MCQLMASRYDDHNNRPSHSKQNWTRGNPSSYDKHNRHDQSHDKLASGDSRSSGSRKDRNEDNKEKSKPRQIGDWSEHTSSSGKRYYYNVVTEQSQWEKPLEWIEFEKLNGLSKQKRSANHAEPTTNGQDRSRSSGMDERSRSSSSRHQHDIANGVDVANNWPNCRDEATSSSKRQRDNSTAESTGSQHYRNDNGYTADRDRPNHSRKRREQVDVSPKHLSSSPKRRKGERDNDLNTILVEDTNASASCSNDMDSSNADGLGDVDLEKLPELLVEIAEKYSIDLRQPDALEKLKHYLKSTLQIDHQIIEAKAEESALSTVIQPSPSSSAKSNCIDSATDPEEAAVDSLPEARVPRIPTPLPEIPILSQNHLIYFREPLAAHVAGWSAEVFERQARFVNDEAFRTGCLQVAQVSADLKCARSLVRTAEIRATLLEQRISFLRQQQEKLDVKRQSASSAATN